jgi:CBS domain containing-hemolysin-like protein
MAAFFTLMYPALYVLNGSSNLVLKLFGLSPVRETEVKHSADEIRLIVEATFGNSDKDRVKRELLERVLRATDRPVRALMLPRVDMITLSLTQNMDEWLAEIRRSGYSRYPVTQEGNADHIRGYVYVKDLLLAQTPPRSGLRGLLRDLLFVPESLTLGEVLTRFRRSNIPIAIVVDEYGGTSGLVTVEDVVEELVGDLQDELDVNEAKVELREDGTLVVDGSVPLGNVPLDGVQYDGTIAADTVGGYIIEQLGRLAHPGDRVQIGGYEATVEDMRRRRIGRVSFRPHHPTTAPPPPGFDIERLHSSHPPVRASLPPKKEEEEPEAPV